MSKQGTDARLLSNWKKVPGIFSGRFHAPDGPGAIRDGGIICDFTQVLTIVDGGWNGYNVSIPPSKYVFVAPVGSGLQAFLFLRVSSYASQHISMDSTYTMLLTMPESRISSGWIFVLSARPLLRPPIFIWEMSIISVHMRPGGPVRIKGIVPT